MLKTAYALRQVQEAVGQLAVRMQRMHAACEVRPSDLRLKPIDGPSAQVQLECPPVVCRVPERATHVDADLYVVFTGWISFDSSHRRMLATTSFATNFGYFAIRKGAAAHVLGGHYDHAVGDAAHPRAHVQLRSQATLYDHAQAQFHSLADTPCTEDAMKHVLSRVRIPSAQMDFLSFMLQICADHLVDGKHLQRVADFSALASSCEPVIGYNAHEPPPACQCHRAPHWYRGA